LGFVRTPIVVVSEQGVTRTLHRWDPDPALIPSLQRAFALRAGGASLAKIHAELKLFGGINQYSYFFSNPLYIGTLVYGDLTIENYCEPLIALPIWQAVQKLIQLYAARQNVNAAGGSHHPRRINSAMALSGLAYCARCGSPLYGHNSPRPDKSKASDHSYKCTRARRRRDCDLPRISAPAAELAIIAEFERIAQDPHYLAVMHAELQALTESANAANAAKLEAVNHQLRSLRLKIGNLADAIAETGSHALFQRLALLETEQLAAEQQKFDLQNQPTQSPAPPDEISQIMQKLIDKMRNPQTRRDTFRLVLQSVSLDRHDQRLSIGMNIKIPSDKPPPQSDHVPMFMSPLVALVHRHIFAAPEKATLSRA
jgi:hypothetical protein